MDLRKIIRHGWKGEVSLSVAFWQYFVLGQFGFALVLIIMAVLNP